MNTGEQSDGTADYADYAERKRDHVPPSVRDPQTFAIIGALMEVHRELGCGFLEAVYQEGTEREFVNRRIPFQRQVNMLIQYKGATLKCGYCADFICYGQIIVEIKAIKKLTDIDRAQTINYLKVTRLHRAILANFGASSLEYERIVNQY